MNSTKKLAHIAGVLYLILAISGVIGIMYIPSKLIVAGNATETIDNIMASSLLFKIGIVSELICQTTFVILVVVLYNVFKHVNKMQVQLMVAFVVVAIPIAFIGSANHFFVLELLQREIFRTGFATEQLHAHVMSFLKLHDLGVRVASIFWGLWLFPLGYLAYKSNMLPRIFGILLMLACFAYLIEFAVVVFVPEYYFITYPGSAISALAEFSFLFWILIKGVKEVSPRAIS